MYCSKFVFQHKLWMQKLIFDTINILYMIKTDNRIRLNRGLNVRVRHDNILCSQFECVIMFETFVHFMNS